MRRAALLAAVLTTAACRQIAGIQDLPKPCADPLIIDDMEDGDHFICKSGGRRGTWWVAGDGTSTDLTPAPDAFKPTPIPNGERGSSRYAAHFKGSGFTNWGALMGLDLNSEGVSSGTYDASSAGAITFWMKSNVPVTVQFDTPDTKQPDIGGNCIDSPTAHNCSVSFFFPITAPAATWTKYRVPFQALQQAGSATWKPRELLSIFFGVGVGAPFDVWVDDIAFEHCSYYECVPTCTDPRLPVACAKQSMNGHPAGCFPPETEAACSAIDTWCADPMILDDLEDGDGVICHADGRGGTWYTVGDGTSVDLTPPPGTQFLPAAIDGGGRGGSHRAAHFSGSGFTDWGALMAFRLSSGAVYDASAAGGITFWMKSNVPIGVEVLTSDTVLPIYGGTCVDTATVKNCNRNFRFDISARVSDWQQVKVPFTALIQSGSAVWEPTQFNGVQFVAGPNAPFDVWIDDVAFYDCAGDACAPTCLDPALPMACPAKSGHAATCFPSGIDCATIDIGCDADPLLIDNMEDGNGLICSSGGRGGVWWAASDKTSTDMTPPVGRNVVPTPIPGGRGDSHYAMRLAGSGFTGWGAQIALDVKNGAPYDASAAGGIKFWMKGKASKVIVDIATPESITKNAGGTCDQDQETCNNDFMTAFVPDPDQWQEYEIPFAAFRRPAGTAAATGNTIPEPNPLDPSEIVWIKFTVPGELYGSAAPFEIWLDDLAFYNCSGTACVPTCREPDLPLVCPASSTLPAGCYPAGTDCAARSEVVHNLGAWGSGSSDVWAVGWSNVTSTGTVLHYDGTKWARVDVGTVPVLWDVTGSGANDLWIAGDHGAILRRQGSAWSTTTAGTDNSLSGVWANGPGDAWATDYLGTIRHWNGSTSTWSPSTSVTKILFGMWASAPNDVWAVGDGGTILHYDGTGWLPKPSSTTVFLNRVWGSAANDVWAVADSGPVLHYDGTRWAASPGDMGGYLGVWGSGSNDVWAVGYSGAIAHWNGTAWSAAVSSPTKLTLFDVWGSGPNDVWAVGVGNTILHYDGTAWTPVAVTW